MTASANTISPDPTVPTPEPRIMTIGDYLRMVKGDLNYLHNIHDLCMVVVGTMTMDVKGNLLPPSRVGISSCWNDRDEALLGLLKRAKSIYEGRDPEVDLFW